MPQLAHFFPLPPFPELGGIIISYPEQYKYSNYPGGNGTYVTGGEYLGTSLDVKVFVYDVEKTVIFDVYEDICLSFMQIHALFYFNYIIYSGLLIFCCQNVATLLL